MSTQNLTGLPPNCVGNYIYKENVMKNSFKKGKKHIQSHTDEERQSLTKWSSITQQIKDRVFFPYRLS